MVPSALSSGCSVADGDNFSRKPVSEFAVESDGGCDIVVKLVIFLGKKNVEAQINVRILVFAVDVKHFVVEVVDELDIALLQMGHLLGAAIAKAKGQDKDERETIKLGHCHAIHLQMLRTTMV